MGKTSYLIIGAALGAAAAVVINYFFGPAEDAVFDQQYRSRLDHALEEGRRASTAREAELRSQFDAMRRPSSPPAP